VLVNQLCHPQLQTFYIIVLADMSSYIYYANYYIIQHHKDTQDTSRTLVARLSPNLSIPPELSTLLLSAILIDTHGLKLGGKALDVDREAAAV
jgi:hypothetical protein